MEGADALTQRDVFLKENAVEGPFAGELQRQFSGSFTVGKRPIAVIAAGQDIRGREGAAAGRACGPRARGQIGGENRIERRPEFQQPEGIDRVDATACVGRHVEQQQRIAAHAFIIDFQELPDAFYLRRFRSAPEPAGPDGNIRFGRSPMGSAGRPGVQDVCRRATRPGLKTPDFERGPVGAAGLAPLVADPAATGTDIAENDGLRLQAKNRFVEQRPVIDLSPPRRAFPAGAVEPLLKDRSVCTAEHALECSYECCIVCWRPVARIVPVPGRNINPELQAVGRTGIGKFPQNVPLSVPPAALCHCMGTLRRRPQTETVVVLRRDDYALESGRPRHGRPLPAVQLRGIEDVFRLRPVPPFGTRKRVGTEVAEQVHFHLLPGDLVRRRAGSVWGRRRHTACRHGQAGSKQQEGERLFHGIRFESVNLRKINCIFVF